MIAFRAGISAAVVCMSSSLDRSFLCVILMSGLHKRAVPPPFCCCWLFLGVCSV